MRRAPLDVVLHASPAIARGNDRQPNVVAAIAAATAAATKAFFLIGPPQ
jgi:hypothetical protein